MYKNCVICTDSSARNTARGVLSVLATLRMGLQLQLQAHSLSHPDKYKNENAPKYVFQGPKLKKNSHLTIPGPTRLDTP